MLKTSLSFIVAALLAALFIDIEISTVSPLGELQKIIYGIITPSFERLPEIWPALFKTIILAVLSCTLGITGGSLLAFFYNRWHVRLFCTTLRSIHEIFWALLLIPILGLSPLCGVVAIAIPFTGIFAKVFSEIESESDRAPRQGIAASSDRGSRFLYGILPVITPTLLNYSRYRFECALRSSAVLGFLGIPTIGFYLETMFREGYYHQAAGLMMIFYLLIFSLRYWLKFLPLLPIFLISLIYILYDFTIYPGGASYLHELTPWPLRSQQPFDQWFGDLFDLAGEGLLNTLTLTQVSIVCTALVALILVPPASPKFVSRGVSHLFNLLLIILRTTPDIFVAYLFLVLLGPSMLPAIIALSLHNGAIMAHLNVGLCDKLTMPEAVYKRKTDAYFYWYLPQLFGQFLAFLFLRWEVMIRDSALLGIIGIYTIGFYIDSAISDDHMDIALALILLSGLLTLIVDLTSHWVRRRLKLSGISTCLYQ